MRAVWLLDEAALPRFFHAAPFAYRRDVEAPRGFVDEAKVDQAVRSAPMFRFKPRLQPNLDQRRDLKLTEWCKERAHIGTP